MPPKIRLLRLFKIVLPSPNLSIERQADVKWSIYSGHLFAQILRQSVAVSFVSDSQNKASRFKWIYTFALSCTIDIYISIICTQSVLFSPFEDAGGPDDPESEN